MMESCARVKVAGRIGRMEFTRRSVLASLGLASLGAMTTSRIGTALTSSSTTETPGTCPFRLAVINDEITQDFEKACSIAAKDFGLSWIELRGMWNKNITELNAKEVDEARKILEAHRLRVTDIARPLFKVD